MKDWEKQGLVITPNKSLWWNKSHCMIPTPQTLKNGNIKIFFSGRDKKNISHIGYAIIDIEDNFKTLEYSAEPILSPGKLGCFDDNGVTPSCIKTINEKIYLYYIGWNPASTVRMSLFGGLAISEDGGANFVRWSEAPIIERSRTDPYLNTAPWIVKNRNEFRMYYVSGCGWINKDLPRYNIKIAFSKDGCNWKRDGKICIDFKNNTENAIARPFVYKEKEIWKMIYSFKGKAYRLGYAESRDGINWNRKDDEIIIPKSKNGFDSEMVEYGVIIRKNGKKILFYNGNNYGYDGIGVAVSYD